MGNRKAHRSNNPLLVASSAITRAIDPDKPSRITVIRLLGDALYALQESQIAVDAIKSRTASYSSKNSSQSLTSTRLESDSRVRASHEQGARALFSATVTALLKLPCRAGPLRRRAVDLLHIAVMAAGPAVAMQAADRIRAHISSLKKLSWSESDAADFEIVCAVNTLAEVAQCNIAGREVARESVIYLLAQRAKQTCKRGDLAQAIAVIIQSFPQHAPPDDRLVDNILELCLSSAALKQGTAGFGTALLAAIAVPFLVSRGPLAADNIVNSCAKALRLAPTSTERGMWSLALVRASVTARRSTNYQVRKYGNSDTSSKFPRGAASGGASQFSKQSDGSDASDWVSNETFEESLGQVALKTNLSEGRIDASTAAAAVLRMWSQALPDTTPIIIPRAMGKLIPSLRSVSGISAMVDAIWLGVLKHLKPSQSSSVLENLLPALDDSGLPLAAALHICASLLAKHGRQAIRETGLTIDYNHLTTTLINRANEGLNSSVSAVRFGAVRLMSSIIDALPRSCTQFLTAVLQNLRIADLSLATKEIPHDVASTHANKININFSEPELSSILGHAAALSALIETVTVGKCSVPIALVRQCSIDSVALLRRHQAEEDGSTLGPLPSCVRRRVGWGLVAVLAIGNSSSLFKGESLTELVTLWKEELRYFLGKASQDSRPPSVFNYAPVTIFSDISEQLGANNFDENLAQSATRSAALFALSCALQHARSSELEQCANALMGTVAARTIAILTSILYSVNPSTATSANAAISFRIDNLQFSDAVKKRNAIQMVKMLALECSHLVQCMALVPPRGEAAELCYMVALALGEEAQKVLGEMEDLQPINMQLTPGSGSDKGSMTESILRNSRWSVYSLGSLLMEKNLQKIGRKTTRKTERSSRSMPKTESPEYETERAWLFGEKGIDNPCAEYVMVSSARGIAAVVALDLDSSGSLIESLSNAKICSSFSAIVALETTRRLSRSDLAEINRALAVLQVLTKRTLSLTSGCRRAILSQSKSGRVYTPASSGDASALRHEHVPGVALKKIAQAGGWLSWARTFSDEGHINVVPFHDFHTRALGMMYATRTLAAEAHRELSVTGGPKLWIGLMRKVVALVKDNVESSSASQSIVLSNAIATLGALLEVVPEPNGCLSANTNLGDSSILDRSKTLDEISQQAIDIVANTIENGKTDVQVAAALSLSSCSHRVASSSERLLAALLHAWAEDKGEFVSLGHLGRCASEADIWATCFRHVWSDMGVSSTNQQFKFFHQESYGVGSSSVSFATGAAAILASCRLHWWPLTESCFSSVKELCTELLQWTGEHSQRARAAGFHAMTALWAAKVDSARAKRLTSIAIGKDQIPNATSFVSEDPEDSPVLNVDEFSLKDVSRISSPVGPFLDEIVYKALAPVADPDQSCGLQVAACSAVLEMIRGAGAKQVCLNLSRLPENLFPALENGIMEAERVMEGVLKEDSVRRPRYWFGLCRAVCFNAERLNHGVEKSKWDLSYRSKSYAAGVATGVIEESMASCSCLTGQSSEPGFVTHDCAYGFIRKVFDFAKELCRGNASDYQTCEEACVLFQRVLYRIGSTIEQGKGWPNLATDLSDMWRSCVPLLQRLMTDNVPQSVVHAATSAVCEELVLSLRLQGSIDSSAVGPVNRVFAFLDSAISTDIRKQLQYADQGEEVSARAVLALISKHARVLSAAREATGSGSSVLKSWLESGASLGAFLYSVCGDFVAGLSSDGLKAIASLGGSVTTSMIEEAELQGAMSSFIAPIVLGAMSISDVMDVEEKRFHLLCSWNNVDSPGARLALLSSERQTIAVALMVWLLCHEHADAFSKLDRLSFFAQSREALQSHVADGKELNVYSEEALMSFAQRNATEFLKFIENVGRNYVSGTLNFVLNLLITVAVEALQDVFTVFREKDAGSIARTFRALRNVIVGYQQLGYPKELRIAIATVLDFVFLSSNNDDEAMASIFSSEEVQPSLCDLLRECLFAEGTISQFSTLCTLRAKELYQYGLINSSTGHIRLATLITTTLVSAPREPDDQTLIELLLSNDDKGSAFAISLGCNGVEDILVRSINALSSSEPTESAPSALCLLHRIGGLAVEEEYFSASVALRCATSAILVEGEKSLIANTLGMVLYTTLQSRLLLSLPDTNQEDKQSTSCTLEREVAYLEDILREDEVCLEDFVGSMGKRERKRVIRWLKNSERPLSSSSLTK